MKKISRSVAVIMVLVMLSSSLTGCLSIWIMTGEYPGGLASSGNSAGDLVFYAAVFAIDICLLPIALIVFIGRKSAEAARNKRGNMLDGIDTFSKLINSMPEEELASLIEAFDSIPDDELASLMEAYNSMPEAEIAAFTETLTSFSQEELSSIVASVNTLSEDEIASSLATLNSMPEESFVSTMNNLQNIQFCYQK
jgi:hypothetical protein